MEASRIYSAVLLTLLVAAPGAAFSQTPQKALPSQPSAPASPVTAFYTPAGVSWQATVPYGSAHLRITGPNNFVYERDYGGGPLSVSLADAKGQTVADGLYNYDLILSSLPLGAMSTALKGTSETRQSFSTGNGTTFSGTILIASGQVVQPVGGAARDPAPGLKSTADQVIADDLIVQGSACVGFDCVNNESFGFDTLRLKENNTRIKFDDTSTSAGFPNHDWQLTANDSASGGANKFSIEDVTAGTVPFTVTGSAPSNSLFVASTGRVGLRTSTPVLDLHIATGNTPGMRLEQNSSGGFTAQTWDIAGNEANFFVRDVTGGSLLPFRIRPGAPTSSIDIAASGNVGVGTASPAQKLSVTNTSGDAAVRLSQSGGAIAADWDMTNRRDSGRLNFTDDTTGARIPVKFAPNAVNNLFRVGAVSTDTVDVNGTLTVNGTFNNLSSRDFKNILASVDGRAILAEVSSLPLFTWSYKNSNGERHFGPVAEDFYSRFHLGTDEKHISPNDMAGVALAATQALNQMIAEKDAEIRSLKERLSRLERLLTGAGPDKGAR